nr:MULTISPECIES: universal stress protein [Lactococcus]
MIRYKNILVPVDGSENAYKALREAVEIAQANKDEISILIVQDDGKLYGHALPIPKQRYTRASEMIVQEALDVVKDTVKSQIFVVVGLPKKQIVEFATEQKSDLIVMGATGANYFERMTLGSTTAYVVNHAPCNVTVVK